MSRPITQDDLVLHDGVSVLRMDLVIQQGLTLEDIEELKRLHIEKDEIFRRAHAEMKEHEFKMQRAWGFEPDETMHTWRMSIPNPSKHPEYPEVAR